MDFTSGGFEILEKKINEAKKHFTLWDVYFLGDNILDPPPSENLSEDTYYYDENVYVDIPEAMRGNNTIVWLGF